MSGQFYITNCSRESRDRFSVLNWDTESRDYRDQHT